MKQKTNKLAIVMWRYSLFFLVIIPTPIFIMLDPMCETLFSNIWIVFGCVALLCGIGLYLMQHNAKL